MKTARGGYPKDCGARALAAACHIMGLSMDYSRVLELARPDRHGVSLLKLKQAAENLGLRASLLRTNRAGLCSLDKPLIVHLKWNHFDVITHCDNNTVTLKGRSIWNRVPFWLFKLEWSGAVMILANK